MDLVIKGLKSKTPNNKQRKRKLSLRCCVSFGAVSFAVKRKVFLPILAIPAVIGREAGYTLDRLPFHHRPHRDKRDTQPSTLTLTPRDNLESPVNLTCGHHSGVTVCESKSKKLFCFIKKTQKKNHSHCISDTVLIELLDNIYKLL